MFTPEVAGFLLIVSGVILLGATLVALDRSYKREFNLHDDQLLALVNEVARIQVEVKLLGSRNNPYGSYANDIEAYFRKLDEEQAPDFFQTIEEIRNDFK